MRIKGSLKSGLGLFRLPSVLGVGMFVVSEQGLSRGVGWALVAHAFLIRRQPENAWAASAHPTKETRKGSLKSGLRLFRLPLVWDVGMFVVLEQGLSRGVGWALVAHALRIQRQSENAWAASAHPTRATGKGSLKSGLGLFRLPLVLGVGMFVVSEQGLSRW